MQIGPHTLHSASLSNHSRVGSVGLWGGLMYWWTSLNTPPLPPFHSHTQTSPPITSPPADCVTNHVPGICGPVSNNNPCPKPPAFWEWSLGLGLYKAIHSEISSLEVLGDSTALSFLLLTMFGVRSGVKMEFFSGSYARLHWGQCFHDACLFQMPVPVTGRA